MATVAAVTYNSGAVREKLRNAGLSNRGVEAIDIAPEPVVKPEPDRLAKLHDAWP